MVAKLNNKGTGAYLTTPEKSLIFTKSHFFSPLDRFSYSQKTAQKEQICGEKMMKKGKKALPLQA